MSRRYFEDEHHAGLYAQHRPRYSQEVFEKIFKYCQDSCGKFKLAVDVGCGTGHQSTLDLLPRFEKVIGVDSSQAQLNQAPRDEPNLEFKKSSAEHMPFLISGSVDLILAACSLHWLDIPGFFQEAERVLTPGGCLAVYTYPWVRLPEPQAQEMLETFISNFLNDFISDRHAMAIDGYSSVHLPFPDNKRCYIDCCMDWTVDQLCSCLATYSTWQLRLKAFPQCDAIDNLHKDLLGFYQRHTGEDVPRIKAIFPVSLLLGRKPSL